MRGIHHSVQAPNDEDWVWELWVVGRPFTKAQPQSTESIVVGFYLRFSSSLGPRPCLCLELSLVRVMIASPRRLGQASRQHPGQMTVWALSQCLGQVHGDPTMVDHNTPRQLFGRPHCEASSAFTIRHITAFPSFALQALLLPLGLLWAFSQAFACDPLPRTKTLCPRQYPLNQTSSTRGFGWLFCTSCHENITQLDWNPRTVVNNNS